MRRKNMLIVFFPDFEGLLSWSQLLLLSYRGAGSHQGKQESSKSLSYREPFAFN
jgi:hypothetical protein